MKTVVHNHYGSRNDSPETQEVNVFSILILMFAAALVLFFTFMYLVPKINSSNPIIDRPNIDTAIDSNY